MGIFGKMFSGEAEGEAAERNRLIAQQYGRESQGYLTTGYDTGVTNFEKGIAAYDPLETLGTKYGKAGDLWLDTMGVNGPEGNARGQSAFQTTPGFALTQEAALRGLDRKHAISGGYASGNADIDTMNWITKNLYEQQYQPWQAGLERGGQQGGAYTGAAVAGQAGGYGSLASLAERYAGNQSGVAGNVASGMADANKLQAAGEASGAKNLLGAGLSLASLAAGPIGAAASGAGSALSSGASSMFGNAMGNQWQLDNTGRWGSQYQGPVR